MVTGMPLGVVNVAIVDAAARGRRRFATGLGIGGALADTVHAGAAFIGVARLVTARPELVRGLALAAAALIAVYAVVAWRAQPAAAAPRDDDRRGGARGVATGFVLTLPNPGALAAWVAVAAALWPDARAAAAVALALGVGAGSALWFALLAYAVGRVPRDHRALRVLPKLALVALLALALAGAARTLLS